MRGRLCFHGKSIVNLESPPLFHPEIAFSELMPARRLRDRSPNRTLLHCAHRPRCEDLARLLYLRDPVPDGLAALPVSL